MNAYLEEIARIIRDPASNLTVAALLAAAVTLGVLILVLALLIAIVGREDRSGAAPRRSDPSAGRSSSRSPRRRTPPVWLPWLLIAAALLSALYAYHATSSDRFCSGACHAMSSIGVTAPEHRQVACVRCHEGRPWLSMPLAAVQRGRYAIGSLLGRTPKDAVVSPDRCLSCHSRDVERTMESSAGIRMSHEEPLDAGYPCEACHEKAAHAREETPGKRPSRMQSCLACHDGKSAPGQCSTCHIRDPGDMPVHDRIYARVRLPLPTCGGCHDQSTCDACHGLRMPHSEAFIAGEHAPLAAFDRKTLCWRCHVSTDCGRCHGDFGSHGPDFKRRHREASWDSACNTCHVRHEGSFCARCHAKRPG